MVDRVIRERIGGILILVILVASVMIYPVAAAGAISTIRPGNTVFIGEQGLDISAAMEGDSILGWWASGAAVGSTSPDYTISVSSPTSFSISPTMFASHAGSWYHLSSLTTANGTAFYVTDPSLAIRVLDTSVGVEVTNKWVPTDDDIQFQIDTNLVQMTSRGVTVPVSIKVRGPDGAILTSLLDKSGASTTIDPYQISTSPQYTGSIWSTKNRATYPPGTYTIWVECNVNSMMDNYGQTGKTISSTVSLLNQDQNPLMGNKGYVTNPTTTIVTTTTIKRPATVTTPILTTPTSTTTTIAPETPPTIVETPLPSLTSPTTVFSTTKSSGFGAITVAFAGLAGLILYSRKRWE